MVNKRVALVGGGGVGVGVTSTLRETADVRNCQPNYLIDHSNPRVREFLKPSAAVGIGTGLVTGALWQLDLGSRLVQDFAMAHTATALPSGIISGLFPVHPGCNETPV